MDIERETVRRGQSFETSLNDAVYSAIAKAVLNPATSVTDVADECEAIIDTARQIADAVAVHVEYKDRYPMAYRNAVRKIVPPMAFEGREYMRCCPDPRLSALQDSAIVKCATCGEVRPPIARIDWSGYPEIEKPSGPEAAVNDVVKTCPFCGDAITDDPDSWDLTVHLFTIHLAEYTCQGCFNTFYVNSRNVPAGALAASLVPA